MRSLSRRTVIKATASSAAVLAVEKNYRGLRAIVFRKDT